MGAPPPSTWQAEAGSPPPPSAALRPSLSGLAGHSGPRCTSVTTRVVPGAGAGAHSPATVAVADAVLAPQVREDVVVESVQQRVHVHQTRDGLQEPMTGQRAVGRAGWVPERAAQGSRDGGERKAAGEGAA